MDENRDKAPARKTRFRPRKKPKGKRLSREQIQERMDRSQVVGSELGKAVIGLRVFNILISIIIVVVTLVAVFAFTNWALLIIVIAIANYAFVEMLINQLKKYKEWARVLGAVYLCFASLFAFIFFPLLVAVFTCLATIPGILGLTNSKTKRVLAQLRAQKEEEKSSPNTRCRECQEPLNEDAITFDDFAVCPKCRDVAVQKIQEGVY